jgi:hypothetical protein
LWYCGNAARASASFRYSAAFAAFTPALYVVCSSGFSRPLLGVGSRGGRRKFSATVVGWAEVSGENPALPCQRLLALDDGVGSDYNRRYGWWWRFHTCEPAFFPHGENLYQGVQWGRHSCLPRATMALLADRNVCPTVVGNAGWWAVAAGLDYHALNRLRDRFPPSVGKAAAR